jgi:cytochrome oxidase assembly protein ShyY1
VLGGFGARPDNLTVLPRNYVLGWFVFAALVLVVTGVAALRAPRRKRDEHERA